MTEADLPDSPAFPPTCIRSVAVSDAVNRDPHPFTLDWDDEAQHQAILEKMQAMAQSPARRLRQPPQRPPTPPPAAKKTATDHRPDRNARRRHRTQTPLLDEELKAYTLSYGGAPTYVYTANTGGTGAAPALRHHRRAGRRHRRTQARHPKRHRRRPPRPHSRA